MYSALFSLLRRLDPEWTHEAGMAVIRTAGLPGPRAPGGGNFVEFFLGGIFGKKNLKTSRCSSPMVGGGGGGGLFCICVESINLT